MSMSKKVIFLIIILLILSLVLFFVFKTWQTNQSAKNRAANFSNYLVAGQITKVSNGSLFIKGLVRSSDSQSSRQEVRTIEFMFTPQTVITKRELTSPKNIKQGESFTPQSIKTPGNISDLIANTSIATLHSKENLFKVDKASLIDIDYVIFKF